MAFVFRLFCYWRIRTERAVIDDNKYFLFGTVYVLASLSRPTLVQSGEGVPKRLSDVRKPGMQVNTQEICHGQITFKVLWSSGLRINMQRRYLFK